MSESETPDSDLLPHSPRTTSFGGFRYEWGSGLLYSGPREIVLPVRASMVLELFLQRPGAVLTKEDLLEAWGDAFVAEDSLTKAISVIRQALGDDPNDPRFIQTLPRRGYRFVADLAPEVDRRASLAGRPDTAARGDQQAGNAPGPNAEPLLATTPVVVRGARVRRSGLLVGIGAVAIFALAWWAGDGGFPGSTGEGAETLEEPIRLRRLRVEPLDRQGVSNELAQRLSDLIVEQLANETTLALVVDGAAARLDRGESVVADATVGGRIRRDGAAVEIVVSVDAIDGNLWRGDWRIPEPQLRLPELARSVFTRLSHLLDLVGPDSEIRGTTSREGTLALVRAAQLLQGAAQQDLNDVAVAEELLDRALTLDPQCARARAAKIGFRAEGVRWEFITMDELPAARSEMDEALLTDPADPLVHVASGLIDHLRGDHEAERLAHARAVELDPRALWGYLALAGSQQEDGALADALATAREAQRLDWYLPATHSKVIDVLLDQERFDDAVDASELLVALEPDGFFGRRILARSLYRRGGVGDVGRAEPILRELHDEWPASPWIHAELRELYQATARGDLVAEEARHLLDLRPEIQ